MTAVLPQLGFLGKIVCALKLIAVYTAAWLFAARWLAFVLVFVVEGPSIPVESILVGFVLLLLSLLVTGATEPAVAVIVVAGPAPRRV